MKRLVLAGGGHAHVEVLRALAALPDARIATTLVSPHPHAIYSGMLPGWIAGHYALEDCTIDLAALARRAGATFHLTTASLVSPGQRELVCSDGNVIGYDALSLDVGAAPLLHAATGVDRHAAPVRPLERLVAGWNSLRERAARGSVDAVSLVGGGAAGVELAFAMERGLRHEFGAEAPHVRLIADTRTVLPEWSPGARRRARRLLRLRNIGVHLGSPVSEVGPGFVRVANGIEFVSSAVFWTAGVAAHGWIHDSGLATDPRGFLLTNDRLQSTSHPAVFGAGDCSVQQGFPVPRAGVFAVRAGPALARNLRAALLGEPLQAHLPKLRYLALLATGERHAIGNWGAFAFQGDWAWRWKDRIDRRFIALYNEPV